MVKSSMKARKNRNSPEILVSLDEGIKRALTEHARRCGVSSSEFIRHAVSRYYGLPLTKQ
jgi:hypothetical protein